MIKWYFKGHEIFFVSAEENLDRDVLKSAHRLGLDPTHEIIKLDDNRTNAESGPTDSTLSNGDSSPESFSALQMVPPQTEPADDETSGLRPVSDVLDFPSTSPDVLENSTDSSSPSVLNGSVSGKRSRKGI